MILGKRMARPARPIRRYDDGCRVRARGQDQKNSVFIRERAKRLECAWDLAGPLMTVGRSVNRTLIKSKLVDVAVICSHGDKHSVPRGELLENNVWIGKDLFPMRPIARAQDL